MDLLRWLRPNTFNEPFVDSPLRNNWYQASSYFVSSFALITTVSEDGSTNIGPYQLSFPFEVINDFSWMVISRPSSNTTANLRRTKKCALNFIEFNKKQIQIVNNFGYPGQETEDKLKYNCFTLMDSPTPGREPSDVNPKILKDAFQVYECTWQEEREFESKFLVNSTSAHFVLRIDDILLKETWKKNLEDGGTRMPHMALTYGFRGGSKFWFGAPKKAFWRSVPNHLGPKHETILYEANHIDEEIRFTKEAAMQLTGIPKPFVKKALNGIIARAKEEGVTEVDEAFVKRINEEGRG